MVYCVCMNCNSNDMELSTNKKFITCNNCGEKEFVGCSVVGYENEEKDE